ncbi:MAG: dihydropteroate synthase, partial [Dehalococcoidia bacterium]|nr:dihydropteroate synthase [Dehalococcoidia bacterium]
MISIGESIHIISQNVRAAVESRDKAFIQDLAMQQVKKGADYLDLNIGPQKKAGAEVMPWMVQTVQEVTDTLLSLDTTNAVAMEAGLKVCKKTPLINSTDSTPERLSALMPLAAKYNANIISLTLAKGGLPTSADARVELAAERIFPAAAENGVPNERIFLDPLVLTVNGNQDQAQETINAVRFFKQMTDPAPMTTCGLSNVSNSCPAEIRPLLNRVFLVMMMGAGLDSAILDTLDHEIMDTVRMIKNRDESTAKGRLLVALYYAYAAMEQFDTTSVNAND